MPEHKVVIILLSFLFLSCLSQERSAEKQNPATDEQPFGKFSVSHISSTPCNDRIAISVQSSFSNGRLLFFVCKIQLDNLKREGESEKEEEKKDDSGILTNKKFEESCKKSLQKRCKE